MLTPNVIKVLYLTRQKNGLKKLIESQQVYRHSRAFIGNRYFNPRVLLQK
jgi:hypothetical protein